MKGTDYPVKVIKMDMLIFVGVVGMFLGIVIAGIVLFESATK